MWKSHTIKAPQRGAKGEGNMTKRELVYSAIAHKATAAVPQAINLTGEGYKAYGEQLLNDYPNPQVRSDLKEGKITFEQAVSLTIGNNVLYTYCPWWTWYNLPDRFTKCEDTPEDLPDTIASGSYEKFFESTEYIKANYDVYQVITIWGSHWEKAYFARGIENFLYDLAGSPEWAQKLLDMIIRKNIVMLENVLPAACGDAVLLGSDWGTQRDLIMSPRCFRTMLKPGEQREYDLVHHYGKQVFVHSCGCILKIMPDLVEMGVDVLNPVQPECMDLKFLKETYPEITYYGGISTQKTLPYGTPAEVVKETEDTIELMSRNGGYITAPSQEIQTDVPYENLRALIDTARAAQGR